MLYLFVRKWQVAVSNSSRVNLHLARLARLRANPVSFQTPVEEIYTALRQMQKSKALSFKLQWRKFTRQP